MDDMNSIAMLFDQLYQKLGRQYASLSRAQRRFLRAITRSSSGIGVTTLSEHFEMTVAGATRMLDKLESAGLIERRRQIGDARQVKVFLTENGAKVLAEADDIYFKRLEGLLSSLTSNELRMLNQLLLKIDFF